jgi:hypothetical protein
VGGHAGSENPLVRGHPADERLRLMRSGLAETGGMGSSHGHGR